MTNDIKAAIFDLDGVLVNTVPIHFKSWARMFSEYGIDFSFEDYKQKVDGIPRIDGTRAILENFSDDEINKAATKKQSYFLECLEKGEIPIFESTVKLINELRKEGLKVAIISSSKNCQTILEKTNLLSLFDAKVTGNDITKGKPDPQVFLRASNLLQISPVNCIVFEDAVLGVEAAKRAGMLCVGINRHDDAQSLKKADLIVNDLVEVNYLKLKEL
ncbi:HAD family hydrolase [bacterium]